MQGCKGHTRHQLDMPVDMLKASFSHGTVEGAFVREGSNLASRVRRGSSVLSLFGN